MGTNGPRWGWGFIKHQLSGPHYRDRIMQCAQYPFYHFLPSCIPILLSISTNFSPSPLPPSSILKKRCVSLILYSGCQEELTWHQVLQDAANPPTSWFPKCSQSVDENQDLWCRAPKEEVGMGALMNLMFYCTSVKCPMLLHFLHSLSRDLHLSWVWPCLVHLGQGYSAGFGIKWGDGAGAAAGPMTGAPPLAGVDPAAPPWAQLPIPAAWKLVVTCNCKISLTKASSLPSCDKSLISLHHSLISEIALCLVNCLLFEGTYIWPFRISYLRTVWTSIKRHDQKIISTAPEGTLLWLSAWGHKTSS